MATGVGAGGKDQGVENWHEGYCATHAVTYLNYYSALVEDKGGMKEGMSVDGVHPNAAGYAIMAPLAQAAIDKVLGK